MVEPKRRLVTTNTLIIWLRSSSIMDKNTGEVLSGTYQPPTAGPNGLCRRGVLKPTPPTAGTYISNVRRGNS